MIKNINDIIIGGFYSYVNQSNCVYVVKVARVTDKSVFVYSLLNDGTFATTAHREGFNNFKKYTLQTSI